MGDKSSLNFSLAPGNALDIYAACPDKEWESGRVGECSTERRDLGL